MVTIVPSRSRSVIAPGAVEVITPRSIRKSLTAPRAADDHLGADQARAEEAVDQAGREGEAALGEPEEEVQRDQGRGQERESAP